MNISRIIPTHDKRGVRIRLSNQTPLLIGRVLFDFQVPGDSRFQEVHVAATAGAYSHVAITEEAKRRLMKDWPEATGVVPLSVRIGPDDHPGWETLECMSVD